MFELYSYSIRKRRNYFNEILYSYVCVLSSYFGLEKLYQENVKCGAL